MQALSTFPRNASFMSASTSKTNDAAKAESAKAEPAQAPENQSQQSQLGALEEDDEFEEFPAQGEHFYFGSLPGC